MSFSISVSRSPFGASPASAGGAPPSAAASPAANTAARTDQTDSVALTSPPPGPGNRAGTRVPPAPDRPQLRQWRGGNAARRRPLLHQPLPPPASRIYRLFGNRARLLGGMRRRCGDRLLVLFRFGLRRLLEHAFGIAGERHPLLGIAGRG